MDPYQQVLVQAEKDTQEKWAAIQTRDVHWYDNPLKFLPSDDIYDLYGNLKPRKKLIVMAWKEFSSIRNGFVDYLEAKVLVNLFLDALRVFSSSATDKQVEALILAKEAESAGITATTYIAQKRNINRHSAYKLLKRAEKSILETSDTDNDIMKVEARIKERARDLPRVCAVCGNVCEDSLKALCNSCHLQYIYRDNYIDDVQREVIADTMRFSSMNHWRKARELVFAEET